MKRTCLAISVLLLLTSFNPAKKQTWVAIGDSITYLNEHTSEPGNRVTRGYMSRVVDRLPHIEYKNHGHSGWTAERMAANFDKQGIEKADIYSIFYGTNDWNAAYPIGSLPDYQNNTGKKTFLGSYRIIVNKIRSLNPNAKIILVTPMQRVDFISIKNFKNTAKGSYVDRKGHYLSEYADAIKLIAASEEFSVVDLYYKSGMRLGKMVEFKRLKDPKTGDYKNYKFPHFIGIPYNPETDEYPYPVEAMGFTYDGLHPSDRGMAVIARMLVKVITHY